MNKRKVIIDISDAKVSGNTNDILVTYSLGSCIGVCVYDENNRHAGMLHYQLPDSKIDPIKAKKEPFMFADTGLKILVDKLVELGCHKKRMKIKIAGGAEMKTSPKGFDIGKRNYLTLRKLLWKHGLFINGEDIGGSSPRNLYIDVESGEVTVKKHQEERKL